MSDTATCPFCLESDFDLPGLKLHLSSRCQVYADTETIGSLASPITPTDHAHRLRELREKISKLPYRSIWIDKEVGSGLKDFEITMVSREDFLALFDSALKPTDE